MVNDTRPSQEPQTLRIAYSTAPPPPNMFLALLTGLPGDVDHWEGLLDDMDAQLLRFDVQWRMNRDGHGR